MQTIATIPAGTLVQTPSGRHATTIDATTLVKNSETGTITGTNLIKFSNDDEACPGGEWLWDASKLTVVPTFTVTFNTDLGPQTRAGRTARQVETFGTLLNRVAQRGRAWDIAVLDTNGDDITDQFACFQD